MNNEIKVITKSVYGRDLVYPVCDNANNFAHLLQVKTFSHFHLIQIEKIGYNVIDSVSGKFYFNSDNSSH